MAFLSKGIKAPEFEVNDQDGKPVRLSDFRGKKVVLYFYPTDGTPTCTTEACNLRDHYKVLQKAGSEERVMENAKKNYAAMIKARKFPAAVQNNASLEQRSATFELPSLLGIGASYDFIFNESNKLLYVRRVGPFLLCVCSGRFVNIKISVLINHGIILQQTNHS